MRVPALAAAALAALSFCAPANAELNSCTEITALPFTITVQGVYCLKQNLNVNLATGNAITVNAGNVVIDFNGFRVNNQAPLATNNANGVYAQDRKNITLRNGFIRGFYDGVFLAESTTDASASHLVESMKIADSGSAGIFVEGDGSVIRDNRVLDTGGGPSTVAYGIILQKADDGLIAENIVAGLSLSLTNYGVFAFSLPRLRLTDNEISGVDGSGSDRGIGLSFVTGAVIAKNRMVNSPGTGTGGIVEINGSTNIVCRDNEADGFSATPFAGCDFTDGNRTNFN